uniref:Ig-like domain-containing protein n=1 Tax=Erpetoichthys calabaricus TaxID=27687 RepID=A0A8C4XBS9_ERPCA
MQSHRSVRAQLGGSVILECHMPTPSTYTYIWIKLTPGKAPDIIAFWSNLYNKDVAFKENGNVKYEVMKSSSSFNLSITHLDASALGTYYCGVLCIFFGTKIFIEKTDWKRESEPVQYGDDVTLECIINRGVFGDAHQVFWIHRTIRGSYQTIRSTHENKRTCESQECVYSLQKKNFTLGTYYCGVVRPKGILFGNGTEISLTGKCYHLFFSSICFCFIIILFYLKKITLHTLKSNLDNKGPQKSRKAKNEKKRNSTLPNLPSVFHYFIKTYNS